jgi:hypothetical protein
LFSIGLFTCDIPLVLQDLERAVARHHLLCCASHGTTEGAVEKCINRLDDCRSVGLLAWSEQSAPDQLGDLGVAQFENVAAKPPKPALTATPHPPSGSGTSGLDFIGHRGLRFSASGRSRRSEFYRKKR